MSYYKYAERDESVQVNWAEIGKNLTETFQQEATKRETQKAAIDENTRQYANILNTAPQGEFQDGNAFINNYVAAQQETRLLDDKLLKSGQMDMKTYNLRRQNGIDGTKQLFDLQKNFQSVYSERMKGIIDGSLQAQTAFELSQVQGFGDFSKSQALINPVDGRVQIGMTEIVDGVKKVIPNSNIPVNVLMGKIQAALPTFDVNSATKSLVDSQGELVLSLYKAGSISGAGTITELTGLAALEKFADKEWTEAANSLNKAINNGVNAMLINPRNLTSVLTGQVGGYSAESFTYDKDVAAKDPSKILLKPSTDGGPGVMDDKAPNYQKQYKQAADWITTSIKSQMDAKVGKKETSQLSRNDEPADLRAQRITDKEKEAAAGYWNTIYTGKTLAEKQAAADILLRTPIAFDKGLTGIDIKPDNTITLTYLNPSNNNTIKFTDNNNNPIPLDQFSALGVELHGVVDRNKAVRAGGGGGAFVPITGNISAKKQGKAAAAKPITVPLAAITQSSQNAITAIKSSLPEGFKANDTGGRFGNTIEIIAPNGKVYKYETKKGVTTATAIKTDIEQFIKNNMPEL